MLKIGIYRSTGIGDVVLATACLAALTARSVEVVWIGREPALGLIRSAYPGVLTVAEGSDLGDFPRVDVLVDLQRSLRSQRICRSLARRFGCKLTTWEKGSVRRAVLVASALLRGRRSALAIRGGFEQRFAEMASVAHRAAGLPSAEAPRPCLPVFPRRRVGIAVALGSLHPAKEAPVETFAAILRPALAERRVRLVALGDGRACERTKCLRRLLPSDVEFEDLTGMTALWDAAHTLAGVKAFIGNDSALAHIAEAVGTPVAMLFGPTVEAFGYGPFLSASRAFSAPLGCRPCSRDGSRACRYRDQACFAGIDPVPVASWLMAVQQLP